jgi:hypothetical protein
MRTPTVAKILMEFREAWFHSAVSQLKSMTLEKAYVPKHHQHVSLDRFIFAEPGQPAICQGVSDSVPTPLFTDYETIKVTGSFAGADCSATDNVAVHLCHEVFGGNGFRTLRAIERSLEV